MNNKLQQNPSQPSILDFVDSPNYNTAKDRLPRSVTKTISVQRRSSSTSSSRKRKASEVFSPTSPEKKVIMEPEKSKGEDYLDNALKAMEARLNKSMKDMIDPLQSSINSILETQKDWAEQQRIVTELKAEKDVLARKIQVVEFKNTKLEDRIKVLVDKLMESNIIMHGIKESSWELDSMRKELVVNAIASTITVDDSDKKLEIARNIPIKSTKRLGKYNSLRSRPICISFTSKSDADLLIERKKMLQEGVYMDRGYSIEDEQKRRKLRPILRAAHRLTQYRGKCKLDGTTLVLKGKKYDVNTLHTLPNELNGFNITSKQEDKVLCFFGEQNPFSNFHPAKFSLNGIQYHCTEQMIQHNKAIFFGDKTTAAKILNCIDALECKRTAKEISNYDHEKWKDIARSMCEEGIKAKFLQNQPLRDLLLSAKGKDLAECCADTLWGTGVPLHEDTCLDKTTWKSQGLLGQILCSVRDYIDDILGTNRTTGHS